MRTASLAARSKFYAVDIARTALRLIFKRVRRTGSVVDAAYNLGEWDRVLKQQAWLEADDLEAFLVGTNKSRLLAKVDNEIVHIATDDYYRYRLKALGDLLMRHAGTADCLLELGAGFGYNLFALSLMNKWQRLRGLEIAPNGIAAGRRIAEHFTLGNIVSFDHIDLTNDRDPAFSEVAGSTLFTYFCIEQIPHEVDTVIENILRAGPKRVINIETSTEMLNLTQPRDLVSLAYIRSMDYQTRLFTVLDRLERQGRIRILARERMGFAPTIHYDGLLYSWEPVAT